MCNGCGDSRPCYLEVNQHETPSMYLEIEDLKCVLDSTNQTSYNWTQIKTH